jgi:hypothetical protein
MRDKTFEKMRWALPMKLYGQIKFLANKVNQSLNARLQRSNI